MISLSELKNIIDNNDSSYLEDLAKQANKTTVQNFGRTVSLYAPLYLSNFCNNLCIYCGFNKNRLIKRKKLSRQEMDEEMQKISDSGIQNILLLTGESRQITPVNYIKEAVSQAKKYFSCINLEVYPMEVDEYRELFLTGVDGVTIYQETYNKKKYKELHQGGHKSDFNFRYSTPERIAKSGIRMICMGVLLGLSEIPEDIHNLFLHLEWMEKNHPGVEYSLSFPRLIPLRDTGITYIDVTDITLIKLICIARILFPRVGINLSTRERPHIRDHALMLGITKISAASKTTVGGYSLIKSKDPQFDVQDNRSVKEIVGMLKHKGFDPIFTEWRHFHNEMI